MSMKSLGWNRAIRLSGAPASIAASITDAWPKTWNRGNAVPTASASVYSPSLPEIPAADFRLPTVSSAPLGLPVVPEV